MRAVRIVGRTVDADARSHEAWTQPQSVRFPSNAKKRPTLAKKVGRLEVVQVQSGCRITGLCDRVLIVS